MSMQHEYNEMCSGRWAEVNPSKCPCRGRGYLLSDLDTWHQCPQHGAGVPHPETEMEEPSDFDYAAHDLALFRSAFLYFVNAALALMGSKAEVQAAVKRERTGNTPQDFVDAAERVLDRAAYEAREAQAHARGFSCGLDMEWSNEAMWERKERELAL
jgi:hypothetical protein